MKKLWGRRNTVLIGADVSPVLFCVLHPLCTDSHSLTQIHMLVIVSLRLAQIHPAALRITQIRVVSLSGLLSLIQINSTSVRLKTPSDLLSLTQIDSDSCKFTQFRSDSSSSTKTQSNSQIIIQSHSHSLKIHQIH